MLDDTAEPQEWNGVAKLRPTNFILALLDQLCVILGTIQDKREEEEELWRVAFGYIALIRKAPSGLDPDMPVQLLLRQLPEIFKGLKQGGSE